jgi:hypothetical protein
MDRWARLTANLVDGASRGGQIRLETHLLADPQKLFLRLQYFEKFAKILKGFHDHIPLPCLPGSAGSVR